MLQGIARNAQDFTWNYPSWSISAELFAYLTFAICIVFINRIAAPIWRSISLLPIALIALLIEVAGAGYFVNIVLCIWGFFIGGLVNMIYCHKWQFRFSIQTCTCLEIISFVGLIASVCYLPKSLNLALTPIYGLIILVFARERGLLSMWITRKFTIWLGTLSYSIYMTHALIASILKVALLNILEVSSTWYDLSATVFLVIAISFSSLTYRFIEVKGQQLVRSMVA